VASVYAIYGFCTLCVLLPIRSFFPFSGAPRFFAIRFRTRFSLFLHLFVGPPRALCKCKWCKLLQHRAIASLCYCLTQNTAGKLVSTPRAKTTTGWPSNRYRFGGCQTVAAPWHGHSTLLWLTETVIVVKQRQ